MHRITESKGGMTYYEQIVNYVDLQIIPCTCFIIFTERDIGSMISRFEKQQYIFFYHIQRIIFLLKTVFLQKLQESIRYKFAHQ